MKIYTDSESFSAEHNWRKGCEMGRVAGSSTMECDTHGAALVLDIPVILRDI